MNIVFSVGVIIVIFSGVWLLVEAFKVSVAWGVGCFLISPISILFLIKHWDVGKNPFLMNIAGLVLVFISIYFGSVPSI
ncbi:hypothetical protein R6258_03625 [Halomonas sp. HP20-15]|uniref:hypothetical protein n=1 Tax=Halomonas sp. HP20-15 TaxID=3085901 RepID=UPI002982B3EC|nr:hypothetical protein [Halomonas sp. HP20-15]MDW5376004.1 hypothetical protein [Halomonas sp. HP20-15]